MVKMNKFELNKNLFKVTHKCEEGYVIVKSKEQVILNKSYYETIN